MLICKNMLKIHMLYAFNMTIVASASLAPALDDAKICSTNMLCCTK